MTITVDACAGHAYAVGLRGEALVTAVAIAGAESTYDERAFAGPPQYPKDQSYGLWQINMLGSLGPDRRKRYNLKANDDLYDPATNARAMYGISNGGTKWTDWSAFKSGKHRSFWAKAEAACKAVEGRSGGVVASGGLPLEASAPSVIAGERVPPGGGLMEWPPFTQLFPNLSINGGANIGLLVQLTGIGGRVTLSVSSVMEMELTFINARQSGLWQQLLPLTGVRWGDFSMIVARRWWAEQDGHETFNVALRSAGVHKMRQPESGKAWSNMSPTQVLAEPRASASGLRFYGKGTPTRPTITRLGADDAGRQLAESDWELGQRLAREEGFWCFEAGGALYFAPPTWLEEHGTRFPVRHRATGSEAAWNTIGFPDAATDVDDVLSVNAIVSTVSMPLPQHRGRQVRPGMVADYRGTPGYLYNLQYQTPMRLVVTDVTWDFDSGDSPVQITATEPIDPVPDPPESDAAMDDVGSGGVVLPAAGAGKGGNVSNQGKGSYGYQYDAVGDNPATGPQPGAKILMAHLLHKFTASGDSGIFNDRKVDGSSSKSVHAEGRAGDSRVPVSSAHGKSLADYLVANATIFGIQYVIYDGRSWRAKGGDSERKWKAYSPANGKTDNTSMHRDHVHWELCWEAARYLNDRAISGAFGNAA